VPMISGRGLGHTGGTLDKLAAIPGYRTELEPAEFAAVVARCGFAMAGAGPDLAPADRRMYAVRDVTGTVPQRSLITASILSKKLAEGLDGLVMDVKVGRGAFLTDAAEARALADGIVATGALAGLPVRAVLTQMDVPLGWAVGNALEVREALDCLRGGGPADLREVTLTLGAALLDLVEAAPSESAGRDALAAALDDGRALECLHANVLAQGGDVDALDALPTAPVVVPLAATRSGVLRDIDPRQVGDVVVDLGGGRRCATDSVDPRVGVVFSHRVGSEVARGEPLAMIYAATTAAADTAAGGLTAAVVIGEDPVDPVPAILRPAGG